MPELTCPGCGHPAARDAFPVAKSCPGCGMSARKAEEINTVRALASGSWRRRVAAFRSRVRRVLDAQPVRDSQESAS